MRSAQHRHPGPKLLEFIRERARPRRHGPTLLMALIALVHLATLTNGPGPDFGDDWALYVLHARNLLEGRPYGDTGYLYNPLNPWYSPPTYPLGFPLLLAPVFAAFGLDFLAMKVVVAASFAGILLLVARFARRDLAPVAVGTTIAVVGLHPYLWRFRQNLLPDLPFTFFCLAAVLLIDRSADPDLPPGRRVPWTLAAAAAVLAAVATRTIGLVLVPTWAVVLLLRARRPRGVLLVGAVLAGLALGAQFLLVPPGAGYYQQIRDLAAAYGSSLFLPGADRVRRMAYALASLWAGDGAAVGLRLATAKALAVTTAVLAAIGLFARIRRPSAPEVFFLAYFAAAFLWPATIARYLVPILPLYVVYAVLGASRAARDAGRAGRAGVAVVAAVVAAQTVVGLSDVHRHPSWVGTASGDAADLYRYVRSHTGPEDRFIASRPRALALFAGRSAAPPPRRADDSTSLAYLARGGMDYVVVRTGQDDARALVERNPASFRPVYANPGFALFRIAATPHADSAHPAGCGAGEAQVRPCSDRSIMTPQSR
ncbi:MAG TPA: hypothetical protein VGR37_15205 [Longimicrobiaceae bacterium]|nr:hypothetical protein [Longimicrobiaceae bacterium]